METMNGGYARLHDRGLSAGVEEEQVSQKKGNVSVMSLDHRQAPRQYIRLFIGLSIITVVFIIVWWNYGFYNNLKKWTQSNRITSKTPPPPTLPQQCGPALKGKSSRYKNESVVAVSRTKTLLVSAYQEHRTGKREVRIIAVVLRNEVVEYRCLFCCLEKLHVSDGVCSIHTDHFNFAYGTADIMCPLPPGCEKPSHIAVTTSAHEPKGHLNQTFLEVKNQNKISDSFKYNFTVCLSTMFDYTNVLQLVQSLEMMQLLGVNRVVIYKTSSSPEVQKILDYYTDKGLVEVIPWSLSRFLKVSRGWLPSHGPGDLHYYGQIPALNDCLYRYMYHSKYVAMQDIDELILPQSVNSWLELLPLLEEKYQADRCYMFENNVFPITVSLPPPISKTSPDRWAVRWPNVSGVNILAHLYQEPITADTHYSNFKIIVNPRAVFSTSVHGLLSSQFGCVWVDRNIARLYHTRAPKRPELTPEKLIYDGRLLSYADRLKAFVDAVLVENGHLPKDSKQ